MSEQTVYPELAGKTAVVTGAARGMGARFAQGLVECGVNVVGGDIDEAAMAATATEINEAVGGAARMLGARLDVTVPEDHRRLAALAKEEFGRVDYWINNAGVFPGADVLDITPEQMRSTFQINVDGALYGTQAAAEAMTEGGSVVIMSSVSGYRVRPGRAAYSASKAAVDHLSRFLAVELGPRGIRVNAIAPGFIDTAMTAWLRDEPGRFESAVASIPLKRIGTTDDVFQAVLFLLSESSSYVTGSTLFVDGGSRNVTTGS